jgi:ABC-type Mn2+/Zn2+ transport system permease subunit
VLVAVSYGLIGPLVVTWGMSFAVHGTAELAFTGAAAGLVIAGNPVAGTLAGSLIVAVLIATLGARRRERDSAIGVILAFGMGIGILLLGYYQGFATAATNILFGNIFGVSGGQLLTLVAIGLLVVAVMATWYRPLLFASIDPEAAKARGVPVRRLGLMFLVVLALTVTGAAQVVGTLLVLSLAITRPPPPSACRSARSSSRRYRLSSPWPPQTAACWPASLPVMSRRACSSPASASPSTSPRAWLAQCSEIAVSGAIAAARPDRPPRHIRPGISLLVTLGRCCWLPYRGSTTPAVRRGECWYPFCEYTPRGIFGRE